MTHDCDRATELLEQVKRKRDANAMAAALLKRNRDASAMVAALLQKNAAGCDCYQAGYLNGQQADEWTLADSLALTAGRMLVAALTIPPAIYLAAGWWLEWEALAFASRVLFVGMAAMAATGYGLRAWRRLKGEASET